MLVKLVIKENMTEYQVTHCIVRSVQYTHTHTQICTACATS